MATTFGQEGSHTGAPESRRTRGNKSDAPSPETLARPKRPAGAGPEPSPRLRKAQRQFLAHLSVERSASHNTIDAYRRDLDKYLVHLASRSVARPEEATREDVASFAETLAAMAPASVARAVVSVRSFHRFMFDEAMTADDPALDVAPPRLPRRLPKALSVDEVARLIDAAGAGEGPVPLRDAALVEILYGTGARISEAVRLTMDDIDSESRAIRLFGKGRKERALPLGECAIGALEAYMVRGRPALAAKGPGVSEIFLNLRGRPLSRQSAWGIVARAAERAGLDSKVSPHCLRHSYATHLLAGGADVRIVQEMLGHASVTTTQIYTLVTADALREVYATAHPRART